MKAIGVIPARLNSTRFEGKVLAEILGKPMIQLVWEQVKKSAKLDDVIIACDNEKVLKVARGFGARAVMTSVDHQSGTDRISEAISKEECDIVVNVQGDEPLVSPDHIDLVITPLIEDSSLNISVGVTSYAKKESSSDIKAVLDLEGNILYCSRADLPSNARTNVREMLKMCFKTHIIEIYEFKIP